MDLFTRGFTYHDEGQLLYASHLVNSGSFPYVDFHFMYTPLSLFLTAFWFRIFGESIFIGRIVALILLCISSLFMYLIARKLSTNKIVPVLSAFLFFIWSSHINFPWPVQYAAHFGLIALFCFMTKRYFLAGILTFLTLFSKQNFGLALIITFLATCYLQKKLLTKKYITPYITGLLFLCLPLGVFLAASNALIPFFTDIYWFTIDRIVIHGLLTTPFFYGSNLFEKIVKGLLYLFPLLISGIAGVISYRNKSLKINETVSLLFVICFYIFSIRPTTDFVHLTSLLTLTGIPLVILFQQSNNATMKLLSFCLLLLFTVTGFYTAFYKGYYRWEAPIVEQTYYLNQRKARVSVGLKYAAIVPPILAEIEKYTNPTDPIFIYDYAPMFYFLSGRENATRWNIVQPGLLSEDDEKEVVQDLQKKKVKLILAHVPLTKENNKIIEKYILKNYKEVSTHAEFIVYIRNW